MIVLDNLCFHEKHHSSKIDIINVKVSYKKFINGSTKYHVSFGF